MELTYKSLLDFEFRHEYFRNFPDRFTYVPQGQTLELMGKRGLLFKKRNNGFTILYQAIKGEGEQLIPLRSLPGRFAFRFWITALSPHAGILSDLPLMRAGSRILYFDNVHDRKDGTTLYLNADAPTDPFAGEKDIVTMAFGTWRNEQSATEPVPVRVQDVFGNVIEVRVSQPVEGKVRSQLELAGIGKGFIRLTPGTGDAESFYIPESVPPPRVFAAIDLYAGKDIPPAYAFTDHNGMPSSPKTFTCRVENRKSIWRYMVVPRFNTGLTAAQLSIEHMDAEHAFLPAGDITTPAGEAAFLIESDGPVPHGEEPVKGLALKKGITKLIAELPNPGPEQIRAHREGFYSEVYVYV
ncbi:MAG: hypothetical protein GY737_19225 [Desulfobacteraceae bacterium]|nr:hypothetical protein [Desulfobacteraceae bacterium]